MRTVQTRVLANRRSHIVAVLLGTIFSLLNVALAQSQTTVSTHAYNVLNSRAQASQQSFYIYLDQDSGFNHGFPSGFFASNTANLGTIHIDTGCIDDANATTGCSIDPTLLDRTHGTVLRISFDAQTARDFPPLNTQEPENWGVLRTGTGYDLRGATSVTFDARSPDHAAAPFGVGLGVVGCMT